MSFSALPWFVREDIINSVVQEFPNYCLLSIEWLTQTAKLHGRILLDYEQPDKELKAPIYATHFERIWIGRAVGINWDYIYSLKSLKDLSINITRPLTEVEYEEFYTKLLRLPQLRSINVQMSFGEFSFDISQCLRTQCKLEELTISLERFSGCSNKDPIAFTSLIELTINRVGPNFDIQNIIKQTPKLKKLNIYPYEPDIQIDFGKKTIPNIRELRVHCIEGDETIKLDLNMWPNLKKLDSNYTVKFPDFTSFTNIEYLAVEGSVDYISDIICSKFNNLCRLDLCVRNTPSIEAISNILKLCNSRIKLKLSEFKKFQLPESLPVEPYAVTDLYLKGTFTVTSNLLRWLSDNFRLEKLKFKYCRLEKGAVLKPVSFSNLQSLKIFTFDNNSYKNHFNRKMYPHINSIILGDTCDFCDICSDVEEEFIDIDPNSLDAKKYKKINMQSIL